MKEIRIYRVFNPINGKFIVEGTASDCAEKLNMTTERFRRVNYEFRQGKYGKLNIYDVTDEYEQEKLLGNYRAAIKKWDDFVTPIREYYGVPVRHLEDHVK